KTTSLQHPTYAYDVKGRGELVLTRIASDSTKSAQLELGDPGLYLILQGEENGPVIAEVTAESAAMKLALPPDEYFVERRASDHYREYRVDLRAGESKSLAQIGYREVAYARLVRKGGGERQAIHGVFVGVGARGQLVSGIGPSANVLVSYGLDLEF